MIDLNFQQHMALSMLDAGTALLTHTGSERDAVSPSSPPSAPSLNANWCEIRYLKKQISSDRASIFYTVSGNAARQITFPPVEQL